MKNLVEKLKKSPRAKRLSVLALSIVAVLAMAVPGFAEGSATAGIQSAVTTALATTQSDILTTIAGVLPYALAIVGAVMVVTIGVKVFKKISGR